MIRPIKFLSLLILFLLLSTYSPTYKNDNLSLIFPIKNIKIENNKILETKKLLNELENIKGKNLLLVDKRIIKFAMNKFDFISGFQVKKIYPETIKILIFEKKPIAIYIEGKNKFYISENGDSIQYIKLDDYNRLPLLFGKKRNFKIFFEELKNISFPINEIKSFHYFEIGRWDITLKDERIIKLPEYNYTDMLENFILIKGDKSFDKYRIFDYRIKDQLILN
mgnify:CR=1 FL=1